MNKKSINFLIIIFVIIIFPISVSFSNNVKKILKIYGYIYDEVTNKPLENCYIAIHDENWNFITSLNSDKKGYYEIEVPKKDIYKIFIDKWNDIREPDIYLTKHEYLPIRKTIYSDVNENIKNLNFYLKYGGNLVIDAYDNNGTKLNLTNFQNYVKNYIFAYGLDYIPNYAIFSSLMNKESLSKENPYLEGDPCLILLPNEKYVIFVLWEVPKFGKVLLYSDNKGEGYYINQKGEIKIINLNIELVETRYYDLIKCREI